jgi:hypothetical protein
MKNKSQEKKPPVSPGTPDDAKRARLAAYRKEFDREWAKVIEPIIDEMEKHGLHRRDTAAQGRGQ